MTSQQEEHVLNVLYFNVLSLICAVFKPEIICVVESWLDDSIEDAEVFIQGYQIVRLDRTRHGGGLVIYVNNLFTCSVLFRGSPNFEFIMLCLTANVLNPSFYLALFYRPPGSNSSLLDTLFSTLCNLNPIIFVNACIIGDFIYHPPTFCTISFCQLCPLLTSPRS